MNRKCFPKTATLFAHVLDKFIKSAVEWCMSPKSGEFVADKVVRAWQMREMSAKPG